ncbi:type II toxin-antitoxin system toxin DNA ADP-ribosyl transferase DarT [Parafrankia elaeagni]|uniref:type II toxin-antitoxin system toxin DNA ADP-ribosyl transferase DarT n=1 Tax=Parafrankia elaeagni TaxID=222534 RepID=UPI0012B5D394|nr:DUF4433 domain-containing protein [Parafrankia elaeagni]
MADLVDRTVMHFTHVANLQSIVRDGGLRADVRLKAEGAAVHECADRDIKEHRRAKPVRVDPYGVVGEYVPFYYAPRSPMLYKIYKGNVDGYDGGQDPLAYIVTTIGTVQQAGLRWVGSDGNCAAGVTRHFNDRKQLEDAVDWQIMTEIMWRDTVEDGDRMRRRMAEFLVRGELPWSCVRGIVVKSDFYKAQAQACVPAATPVAVRDNWYY